MTTPPAAVAVVRATLEDAHLAELEQRPGTTAARVIRALETAGWTIAPTSTVSAPQRAA
ncbi:hypothetical protein [Streptomyces sp. SID5910]|uniref:hypothetical protein n=1 Tax=Streptomyces sp. SID5910 TaxID=2690312 RepID=UPI0013692965|nr:hypothetical protein [Streptomyces sp. SID5910]MYR46624.1 hypothetical protein [Streptomyces sp. SID5910]